MPSESTPGRAEVLLLGGVAGNLSGAAMVLLNWAVSWRGDWKDFAAALALIVSNSGLADLYQAFLRFGALGPLRNTFEMQARLG